MGIEIRIEHIIQDIGLLVSRGGVAGPQKMESSEICESYRGKGYHWLKRMRENGNGFNRREAN